MDYEKEYKKLKGDIKKAYLFAQTDSTKAVLEDILPELKESDDEKIRKELIEALKQLDREKTPVDTYPYFEWVSWLEKHGGQNPADKAEPKFKAGDFIADGRRVLLVLANTEERNLGETYSRYCEGLVLDVYGNVLVNGKDFSGYRLATDIERANFVHDLKVGTKINYKPAWSEEDEWKFSDILALLRGGENYRYNTPELFAWLKSLKDKVQPKQELSEEDEKKIMWLVRLISTAGFRELDNDKMPCSRSELIDWLKSLRPQNTWKPSKEQMEALYDSIPQNVMEISKREMLLDSLYIDLRKL